MSASKLFVLRGSVDLALARRPVREELPRLASCDDAPARAPSGADVIVLHAVTDSSLTRPSETTAWIDAPSGDVLQVEELRPGRRFKRRRFTRDGCHAWRSEPRRRRDRRRAPEDWSSVRDVHEAWPVESAALPTTAGHALLYQAAAARLDREDAGLDVLAWRRGRLLRVELRAREIVALAADFERRAGGTSSRVRGPVSVRRVEVTAVPLDGGPEVDLDVLGMRDRVELFLERGTAVPIEVRGVVDGAGEVRVRLRAVEGSPG